MLSPAFIEFDVLETSSHWENRLEWLHGCLDIDHTSVESMWWEFALCNLNINQFYLANGPTMWLNAIWKRHGLHLTIVMNNWAVLLRDWIEDQMFCQTSVCYALLSVLKDKLLHHNYLQMPQLFWHASGILSLEWLSRMLLPRTWITWPSLSRFWWTVHPKYGELVTRTIVSLVPTEDKTAQSIVVRSLDPFSVGNEISDMRRCRWSSLNCRLCVIV